MWGTDACFAYGFLNNILCIGQGQKLILSNLYGQIENCVDVCFDASFTEIEWALVFS